MCGPLLIQFTLGAQEKLRTVKGKGSKKPVYEMEHFTEKVIGEKRGYGVKKDQGKYIKYGPQTYQNWQF
jgi:hypothetical protein